MGVGADDQIGAPARHLPGKRALPLGDGMAVLGAPVHRDQHDVRHRPRRRDLALDGLGVRGEDHMGLRPLRGGQAVGVLRVGETGKGDAVFLIERDIVLGAVLPEPERQRIVRHGGPKAPGGGNARGAQVIAVIVGGAEQPEPQVIGGASHRGGGGEQRIAARGQLVVHQGLLIDKVEVPPGIKRGDLFIERHKIIAAVFRPALCLQVELAVDQVVAGSGKIHRRLRRGGRRGLRRRRRGRDRRRRGAVGLAAAGQQQGKA